MVKSILVVGNINWHNLREKQINPLLDMGFKVTVLSDLAPEKTEYIDDIDFIHLCESKNTFKSIMVLCNFLMLLLKTGFIFKYEERKRLLFLYRNAITYIGQIESIDFSKFQAVYCHFLTRPVCIAAICSDIPLPILSIIHGSDLYVSSAYTLIDLEIIKLHFSKSRFIQMPGSGECSKATEIGVEKSKILVLPWFINEHEFYPLHLKDESIFLKKKWKLSLDSRVILSVRNLTEIYNIESVIESFYLLTKQNKQNLILVIAGSGDLYSRLNDLAIELNLTTNLIFLGKVSSNELLELYQLSDVYVQNPSSDALPYSILESLACGLPVVCGRIGSICDVYEKLKVIKADNIFFSDAGVLSSQKLSKLLHLALELSEKKYFNDVEHIISVYGSKAGKEGIDRTFYKVINSV